MQKHNQRGMAARFSFDQVGVYRREAGQIMPRRGGAVGDRRYATGKGLFASHYRALKDPAISNCRSAAGGKEGTRLASRYAEA